jgi:hypothetical protein
VLHRKTLYARAALLGSPFYLACLVLEGGRVISGLVSIAMLLVPGDEDAGLVAMDARDRAQSVKGEKSVLIEHVARTSRSRVGAASSRWQKCEHGSQKVVVGGVLVFLTGILIGSA